MDWCRFSYSESIILTAPVGFSRRRETVCFLSTGSCVSLVRSNLTLQYCLTREGPLGTPPRAEWEEAWGKLFVIHGGCIPVPVPRKDLRLCIVSVALLFGGPLHHDLKLHRFSWLPTLLGAASQVALAVKHLPTSAGDKRRCGSILGLGKSLGAGNGHLLQYSCLENSMDSERSLAGPGPQGRRIRRDRAQNTHSLILERKIHKWGKVSVHYLSSVFHNF